MHFIVVNRSHCPYMDMSAIQYLYIGLPGFSEVRGVARFVQWPRPLINDAISIIVMELQHLYMDASAI